MANTIVTSDDITPQQMLVKRRESIYISRCWLMDSKLDHYRFRLSSRDNILIRGSSRKCKGISMKMHSLLKDLVPNDHSDYNTWVHYTKSRQWFK